MAPLIPHVGFWHTWQPLHVTFLILGSGKFSQAPSFYFWCCSMSFLSLMLLSPLFVHTLSLFEWRLTESTVERTERKEPPRKENEPGYPWSSCPLICIHLDLEVVECSKTCQGWIKCQFISVMRQGRVAMYFWGTSLVCLSQNNMWNDTLK